MADFRGKLALVIGGSSGIGRACAHRLAEGGARIVIAARHADKATPVLDELRTLTRARFIPCDLREPGSLQALFATLQADEGRLDIAVNSAAMEGRSFTRLLEYPDDVWDTMLQVNLRAVWQCLKHEIALMLPAARGSIVNIASLAGLQASLTGGAAYTATKHAVVGLSRAVAREYASSGVRVNCVCPALIRTPMAETVLAGRDLDAIGAGHHPVGRIGQPDDVAALVAWLCSDASAFVTGTAIPIDGGLTA